MGSTHVKSGSWNRTVVVEDYASSPNTLTVPINDDFSWDYGQHEDVVVIEGHEYVGTLRGPVTPVTGSFSINMRQDTDSAAAAFLDVVYFRGYVRSNWEPYGTLTAAMFDDGARTAQYKLKVTVEGTALGDSNDHVTEIGRCSFKVAAQLSSLVVQTINFTGWVFTQTA